MKDRDNVIRELLENKTKGNTEADRVWNLAIQRAIDIIMKVRDSQPKAQPAEDALGGDER